MRGTVHIGSRSWIAIGGGILLVILLCGGILLTSSTDHLRLFHYYMHYGEYRAIHPVWQRYGGNRFLLLCYQRLSYSERLFLDSRSIKIEATIDKRKGFCVESKVRHQLQEAGLPEAVLINFYHIPFLLYQCSLTGWGTTTHTSLIEREGQASQKRFIKKLYQYEYTPQGGYWDRLGIQQMTLSIDMTKQVIHSLEIMLTSGEIVGSTFVDSESSHPRQRLISVGRVTYRAGGKREVRFTRWLRADLLRVPRINPESD